MTTRLSKTFQLHFRLIVLITAVIFVTCVSKGVALSNDTRSAKRPFFGLDLDNEQDIARLARDANVSALLQYGSQLSETQLQQFAYLRQALLYTADKMHVATPNETELKAYIRSLPVFTNKQGQFDAAAYDFVRQNPVNIGYYDIPSEMAADPNMAAANFAYSDTIKKAGREMTAGRITALDFAEITNNAGEMLGTYRDKVFSRMRSNFLRILAEEARINAVSKLLVSPGNILTAELQQILKQEDSTWTLQIATIDLTSVKADIKSTDSQLTQYFEANRRRYTIPPRVRVSYAEIPAANYINAFRPSDGEIRAYYDANPERFPKPRSTTATWGAPTTTDNDYNLVRLQVEAALRQQHANAAAHRAAGELAYKLYIDKIAIGSPEFTALLSQNGATLNTAPDFSKNDVPSQFASNREAIAREAFKLHASDRISNPVNSDKGAMILFWQETIPSREATFAEIHEQVAADYTSQENQKHFAKIGQMLRSKIEATIKTGDTFEKAVTKATNSSELTAITKPLAPFTLRTATHLDLNIAAKLNTLKQGDVSEMDITENSGRFIYVQNSQLPDLTEANPNYTVSTQQIAFRYAQKLIDAELAISAPKQ